MTEPSGCSSKSSSSPIINYVKTLQTSVSTEFKFFHALSTFAARPELLIPHVRSTDLDWRFISPDLMKANNNYEINTLFDLLYAPIYHEGKCVPSCHVGELTGSLYEETVKSWTRPENEFKSVAIQRLIHHKPLKDANFGWTSKTNELWDFGNKIVEIVPTVDESARVPYAPKIKAEFLTEEKLCRITLEPFSSCTENDSDDSLEFYANVVVPRIFEWMSNDYNPSSPRLTRQRARPLSYVLNSNYWYFYDFIKSGPAEYIKSIWQESTDPVKFIHEDIGIASYIASLIYDKRGSEYRRHNNIENVDILDLGCGNGLLCFFLSQIFSTFSQKSSVIGFDIRRRKIWAQMLQHKDNQQLSVEPPSLDLVPVTPEKAIFNLLERSLVPHRMDDIIDKYCCSKEELGKRSLWLIGNHSDELTPWIPVISRRMNATGFFVIPCCPFDFFKKYQKRANLPGSSIYQNYIEYACTLGDQFGYQPTLENLRIPSTKKICLVGFDCSRKFSPGILNCQVLNIMKDLRMGDEGSSLAKFVPRSAEISKESQNIDKAVAKPIIDKIFQVLISGWEQNLNSKWYAGREDLTFGTIMTILTTEDREVLKRKGNGLRTLIKSNRHLFDIEKNIIKLRTPQNKDIDNVSQSSRDKIKTRTCYFHTHHPQGCPLSGELCAYKH